MENNVTKNKEIGTKWLSLTIFAGCPIGVVLSLIGFAVFSKSATSFFSLLCIVGAFYFAIMGYALAKRKEYGFVMAIVGYVVAFLFQIVILVLQFSILGIIGLIISSLFVMWNVKYFWKRMEYFNPVDKF